MFHIPPSRSLTPEGRIKKKTNDDVLAQQLDLKKNLTSTVIFSEGSLGLELVARKPRPETIEQRVARRNKEQADEKAQERNVLEKDIRKYARQATMLEFFEGLDTHNQGYISKTALWSTCALHSQDIRDLFVQFPALATIIATPSLLSLHLRTLRPDMVYDAVLEKKVVAHNGGIGFEAFNKWSLLICDEEWLSPLQETALLKQQEQDQKLRALKKEQERAALMKNGRSDQTHAITGGVMVSKIAQGSQADLTKRLRRGMVLEKIYTNETGMSSNASNSSEQWWLTWFGVSLLGLIFFL